jgi:hypothetical protein
LTYLVRHLARRPDLSFALALSKRPSDFQSLAVELFLDLSLLGAGQLGSALPRLVDVSS